MLPLRALLRELDLELAAGEAGLDRPLRWVHISELADPTPWLSGGELLLTTGLGLGDDPAAYLARLARHGLAGVGFGVGFSHPAIPSELLQAAAELEFPLFEVPYELPFIAITEKAFTRLVNEQYAVLRQALGAHERLERIVLCERGLEGVAGELAALVGGPALIYDGRGELLAGRGDAPVAELAAEVRARVAAGGRRGFVPEALAPRGLALPVARTEQVAGRGDGPPPEAWLIAARDAGPLSELDRLSCTRPSPSSPWSSCAGGWSTTRSSGWRATC